LLVEERLIAALLFPVCDHSQRSKISGSLEVKNHQEFLGWYFFIDPVFLLSLESRKRTRPILHPKVHPEHFLQVSAWDYLCPAISMFHILVIATLYMELKKHKTWSKLCICMLRPPRERNWSVYQLLWTYWNRNHCL
jgi:hypothetical protein